MRMLPVLPAPGTTASERRLFEAFAEDDTNGLGVCLHSVGISRHQRKPYAEADFVYVGTQGVFCLEVKGGHVVRKDGTWTIGWPGSCYESREGPFKQAQSARWALKNELESRLSREFMRRIIVGWGVMFPDVQFHEQDPEWDPALVYDSRDLASPVTNYIERVAAFEKGRRSQFTAALSKGDIERIVQVLRHDFEVIPSMSTLIAKSVDELIRLDSDQYGVLDVALEPGNPRVLCYGPAGTGKTLLALRSAELLAADGCKVLFLCFNRILAAHIRNSATLTNLPVTVNSLHQFMREVITRSGMEAELNTALAAADSDTARFVEIYPQLFEDAVLAELEDNDFSTFDVLIIDEAQDILFAPIVDSLSCLLNGGLTTGRWLMFFDPELQSELYGRMDPRVLDYLRGTGAASIPLRHNYRNPEAIANDACTLSKAPLPSCRRALVSEPEYITYTTPQDQGKKLRALLVKLLRDGVSASDISVYSGCRFDRSAIHDFPPDCGKAIQPLRPPLDLTVSDAIRAGTISSAKGLESEVVILTDLPNPRERDAWFRSLCYVGMTRARSKLFVLLDEAASEEVVDRLRHGNPMKEIGR